MMRGSEDVEVFAIWEYDSYGDYERIEADVRKDQGHVHNVLKWYNDNGGREFIIYSHFLQVRNEKLENTVF
ncbi:hypothetical protein GCM10008967_18120 [Bacillus carboniphilus]|uniref:Uncharacterized protein n=1 Tax=Bacillus carboniphilus TaxID=86663 RepID=A0ABP3FW39_9BACI